ncbi:unnamed protein product [Lasius platythorax]|uniref:Uncharacterized protein n=1 Tax=Lasius platythorax TaxID=488582 RepID=A0AAV2NJW7_9HYME
MLFEDYIVDDGTLNLDYRRKCENGKEFATEKYNRLVVCKSNYASIKLIKAAVYNFADFEMGRKTLKIVQLYSGEPLDK